MPNLIREIKLVKNEVKANSNKWWTGQLFDDGKVVATWGRIGYAGDTGEWSGGESFLNQKVREKLKKGYTELKVVASGTIVDSKNVQKQDLHSIAKSQIIKSSNPLLEKLIQRFVDSNVHTITSNTQITYNSTTGLFSTPLGVVSIENIIEARDLLAKLAIKIRNNVFDDSTDTILSQYLRLIPQNIGMKKFSSKSLLPDDNAIQKQNNLIDALESSYQASVSAPATNTINNNTPQEQVFDLEFDVLSDKSECNRLNEFFEKSKKAMHGYDNIHIRNFYKVNIHSMTNAFECKTTPVKEVFHGSSQSNSLSILKSGLKVSPPSTASIAGKMMGNGIYGAINSTKSLGYTFGRWGQGGVGESGWLWICDFAMGKIYESYTATDLPRGYDSVWAKAGHTLRNDELVVYRNTQCKIKYLLECK